MVNRVGQSFAELMNLLQQVSVGLSAGQDDPKQAQYAKEMTALLQTLRNLDESQEKAKTELQNISKQLNEKNKEARSLLSNVISYLESQHGKSGIELQRYGISKRQFAGKKAVKKAPAKD